jgi:gas vesicle protein GvpA/GvpJ/GvpM family
VKANQLLEPEAGQSSLLDLVDNALTKGVVVTGDVVLGLAGVDLVYVRLSVVLCAMERLFARRRD